jgi:DNA-binding GntR family transcriptional regulator
VPAMTATERNSHVDTDEADPRFYIKLAVSIRARIRTGELPAGLAVPSIQNLQEESGYSRQTCGKALRLLEREGLLQRIPGLGYYITPPGPGPG